MTTQRTAAEINSNPTADRLQSNKTKDEVSTLTQPHLEVKSETVQPEGKTEIVRQETKDEPAKPVLMPVEVPMPMHKAVEMAGGVQGQRNNNPKDAWNGMLEKLSRENSGLYAMVQRGRYGGFSNNIFTLELGKEDEILSYLLNEEERAGLIAKLLGEEMGQPVLFSAGGSQRAERASPDPMQDGNIDALAEMFGREKIIVKKEEPAQQAGKCTRIHHEPFQFNNAENATNHSILSKLLQHLSRCLQQCGIFMFSSQK